MPRPALLVFDKFKGSLTAEEACAITAEALAPAVEAGRLTLDLCPLADGGDGFAAILTRSAGGDLVPLTVTGPRGARLTAHYGRVPLARVPAPARRQLGLVDVAAAGWIAVIEMAQASGLAALTEAERDPWQATSRGSGELLAHAAAHGASGILLGVGGSATHDLGFGALGALGFTFNDTHGRPIDPAVPARWPAIAQLRGAVSAGFPPVWIACDVTNPLLGPDGAAAVYAPQKGLAPADLPALEAATAAAAAQLQAHVGARPDAANAPGAGAAGGIAFGLMTAVGARLLPGFDLVAAWLDLDRRLAAAALVVTGEGRFDASSLAGKGPGAVAAQALTQGKPVHVFAGQVAELAPRPGLTLHPITPGGQPLAEALRHAATNLAAAVRQAAPTLTDASPSRA